MSLHTYVIERELPGAGELTEAELHTIATKSNAVIADMKPRVQWVQSYVDRRQDLLHLPGRGRRRGPCPRQGGGFPANVVSEVKSFFDPTTGD